MPNSIVYFDITIGDAPAGRLTFELFDDVVPKVSHTEKDPEALAHSRPLPISSTSVLETKRMLTVSSLLTPDQASTGVSRGKLQHQSRG